MAVSKKTIKQKIKTAGGIKKTTKTMEMISAVKMRRLTARTIGAREYAKYALQLLENISTLDQKENKFIKKRETGKTLLLVMASNKGLCGGYNVNISKKVREYLNTENLDNTNTDIVTIGKFSEKIFNRKGFNIKASFIGINEISEPSEIRTILDIILKEYLKNEEYKEVKLIHTAFAGPMEYKPRTRRILPLSQKMAREIVFGDENQNTKNINLAVYNFEPNKQEVLNKIIPQLLLSTLFESIIESLASEHGSRMIAMKNATDNAKSLEKELTLTYNKVRQGGITQEISEISSGKEALSGASLSI